MPKDLSDNLLVKEAMGTPKRYVEAQRDILGGGLLGLLGWRGYDWYQDRQKDASIDKEAGFNPLAAAAGAGAMGAGIYGSFKLDDMLDSSEVDAGALQNRVALQRLRRRRMLRAAAEQM